MRHHGLTWTEAGALPLGEADYLIQLLEEQVKQQKNQKRSAERQRKAPPGTRLEPIVS
jgi:hypothetical protein